MVVALYNVNGVISGEKSTVIIGMQVHEKTEAKSLKRTTYNCKSKFILGLGSGSIIDVSEKKSTHAPQKEGG